MTLVFPIIYADFAPATQLACLWNCFQQISLRVLCTV